MWKWLNPWRELRQARETIAVLEDRCEDYRQRANEAEEVAFGRASDYYHRRLRMEEERAASAMKQLADIASLTPMKPTDVPDWLALNPDTPSS